MKVKHKAEVNQDGSRQTGVGARWREVQACNREIQPAKDQNYLQEYNPEEVWRRGLDSPQEAIKENTEKEEHK